MGKLGAVGVGLCVVFAAFMVVIAVELYYMWRNKGRKKMGGGFRSVDGAAVAAGRREGSASTWEGNAEGATEGWGMVWLVMSKKKKKGLNLQVRRAAGMEEEDLGGGCAGDMEDAKRNKSLQVLKEGLDDDEEDDEEEEDIFKMAGMWGQPRFLFTIAEETEEEEENAGGGDEDGHGHGHGSSSSSSSSAAASPYLTPPSSPPFATPFGSPSPPPPFLLLLSISAGLQPSSPPPPSIPAGGIALPSTVTSASSAAPPPESSPMAVDIGHPSDATAAFACPLSASSAPSPSAVGSAEHSPAHSLTVDIRQPKTGNSLSVDLRTVSSSMSTGLPVPFLSFKQGVDLKSSSASTPLLASVFDSSSPPETAPVSLDLALREDTANDMGAVSVFHQTVDITSSASTVATTMALRNPSPSLLSVDRSSSASPPAVPLEESLPQSLVSIPSSSSTAPSGMASTAPHLDAAYYFISPKRQQRRPLSLLFDPPPSPSSALNYHCHSRVHPLSPPRTGNASIDCNPLSNVASKPQEPAPPPVSSAQSASSSPCFQIPDVSQPTTPTPFRHIRQHKRV